MIRDNLPSETIARLTGLTIAQLQKFQVENQWLKAIVPISKHGITHLLKKTINAITQAAELTVAQLQKVQARLNCDLRHCYLSKGKRRHFTRRTIASFIRLIIA